MSLIPKVLGILKIYACFTFNLSIPIATARFQGVLLSFQNPEYILLRTVSKVVFSHIHMTFYNSIFNENYRITYQKQEF